LDDDGQWWLLWCQTFPQINLDMFRTPSGTLLQEATPFAENSSLRKSTFHMWKSRISVPSDVLLSKDSFITFETDSIVGITVKFCTSRVSSQFKLTAKKPHENVIEQGRF
jgi:hypothetical protein